MRIARRLTPPSQRFLTRLSIVDGWNPPKEQRPPAELAAFGLGENDDLV